MFPSSKPPHSQVDLISKSLSTENATEADVEALIGIQHGDAPNGNTLDRLDRLGEFGWVSQDPCGTLHLTPTGTTLLRHWMT